MSTFSELLEQVRTTHESLVSELNAQITDRDGEIASLRKRLDDRR